MDFDRLSNKVIGCAVEVHKALGPGLLESAYERCLSRELELSGIPHEVQVPVPLVYKGICLDCGYRIDLVVDRALIVELKCAQEILPVHEAQLLTYMKLAGIKTGLFLNFNVPLLRDGIKSFVL